MLSESDWTQFISLPSIFVPRSLHACEHFIILWGVVLLSANIDLTVTEGLFKGPLWLQSPWVTISLCFFAFGFECTHPLLLQLIQYSNLQSLAISGRKANTDSLATAKYMFMPECRTFMCFCASYINSLVIKCQILYFSINFYSSNSFTFLNDFTLHGVKTKRTSTLLNTACQSQLFFCILFWHIFINGLTKTLSVFCICITLLPKSFVSHFSICVQTLDSSNLSVTITLMHIKHTAC